MKQKPVITAMQPFLDGMTILIDKPLHWTSFDAVKKIRILTGVSKVGHAGTLDPLATGLLIICSGSFTKKISAYMGMEKEYTGTMILGASTATYDLESKPGNFIDVRTLSHSSLYAATKEFTGEIQQIPPIHSAIKKDGKPAYLLARKGKEIVLEPRTVNILSFTITKIALPEVTFNVVCSTGTYIRSLVHDFGKFLNCGAYLSSLRRIRIGDFLVEQAITPDAFAKEIEALKKN
jgi:tRNA pseudouridine55 synthase